MVIIRFWSIIFTGKCATDRIKVLRNPTAVLPVPELEKDGTTALNKENSKKKSWIELYIRHRCHNGYFSLSTSCVTHITFINSYYFHYTTLHTLTKLSVSKCYGEYCRNLSLSTETLQWKLIRYCLIQIYQYYIYIFFRTLNPDCSVAHEGM